MAIFNALKFEGARRPTTLLGYTLILISLGTCSVAYKKIKSSRMLRRKAEQTHANIGANKDQGSLAEACFYNPNQGQTESRSMKAFYKMTEQRLGKVHFVVPFHRASATADFPLNDLTVGRMDIVCRCLTTGLFFSCGTRRNVKMSCVLGDSCDTPHGGVHQTTVEVDGDQIRHCRPDSRNMATTLQKAVQKYFQISSSNKCLDQLRTPSSVDDGMGAKYIAQNKALVGWDVHPHGFEQAVQKAIMEGASHLADLLQQHHNSDPKENEKPDLAPPKTLLLHVVEGGRPIQEVLAQHDMERTHLVVALGDDRGLWVEEEAVLAGLGFVRVSVGQRPLLTSQCITLVLHHYDNLIL